MKNYVSFLVFVFAVATVLPGSAVRAADQPSMVTEAYGNWLYRCVRVEGDRRLCEVAQDVTAFQEGQPSTVLRIAITQDVGGEHRLVIVTPLSVHLPTGLRLSVDDEKSESFAYQICDQAGCWIETTVEQQLIDQLRRGAEGKAVFALRGGRELEVLFSLEGITAALGALDRSRQDS
ncbi:invasion associated locus B family protein [Algihabitans albus]|uniref:invasion associated locus B family protein n=1 Tax=Algihabitans albus TaxID=2164067 RepID=UPI000E5C7C6F